VRIDRGWKFEEGVDDIQSECDLDDFVEWDLVLENDGRRDVEEFLDEIIEKFLE
jgi:phosphomevalonate kinase